MKTHPPSSLRRGDNTGLEKRGGSPSVRSILLVVALAVLGVALVVRLDLTGWEQDGWETYARLVEEELEVEPSMDDVLPEAEQGDEVQFRFEARLLPQAMQGDVNAQFRLGICYLRFEDVERASFWLRKAAEQGCFGAQLCLGILDVSYDDWEGRVQAARWFPTAMQNDDPEAMRYLGIMYALGSGVPQDMAQAVGWIRKAAERHDAAAACLLGYLYETGEGVPQDKARAAGWYHEAARAGYPVVLERLARMFAEGDGIPRDTAEAVNWRRKAAERGDAEAQLRLGMMYARGDGVPWDIKLAATWFGHAMYSKAEAAYQLARLHETGEGIEQNKVMARKYYERATEYRPHVQAQYRLGMLYSRGRRTSEEQTVATSWFRKAAAGGHAGAALEMAGRYARGTGVDKDPVQACVFLLLHMALRDEKTPAAKAKKLMDDLERQLTPEQRAQARQQAAVLMVPALRPQETDRMSLAGLIKELKKLWRYEEKDVPGLFAWEGEEAYEQCARRAEEGEAVAQLELGKVFLTGRGLIAADRRRAMYWFKKAGGQGNAEACFQLAGMYEHGIDDDRSDMPGALAMYRLAAERGHVGAAARLGELCSRGDGTEQDKAAAAVWYRKAAEQGHAASQYALGALCQAGDGVEQDKAEAAVWYRKAAEQGYVDAQYALARLYHTGDGVEQDKAAAAVWYRKAAKQGHGEAQFRLGMLYDDGDGVEQDKAWAYVWYALAVQHLQDAEIRFRLARLYDTGEGVPQNGMQAAALYRSVAELGHVEAQYRLARMYDVGDGIPQDELQAAVWYRKAAEQGHAGAQYNLGIMLYTGDGIPQDKKEGVQWLRKAAAQGYDEAQEYLDELPKAEGGR